jgi:hypothetical protein
MRLLKVSPTRFGDVSVEGGWIARVPLIQIPREDERFAECVEVLRRTGVSAYVAEAVVRESSQRLFEGSWVTKLKLFTGNAARLYVESFGDLEGFDAERAQIAFLPNGDRLLARSGGGNFVLRELFREMRGAP